MAKKKAVLTADSILVLQLVVALLLIFSGILAVDAYNSDSNQFMRDVQDFFGQKVDTTDLIIGILHICAGAVLVAVPFIPVSGRIRGILVLAVIALALIKVIYYHVMANLFEPTFIVWANRVLPQLLIPAALWPVFKRYY